MAGTFRGRSRRHLIALVAFGLPALAAPGRADWLLTRDGARIETRGPWTVKGKLVVFTLASGTLSSLRTTEVDLEASAQSTAEAQARAAAPPAAEKPAEKPPPVLVLTDADVEHVDDDGQPLASGGERDRVRQALADAEGDKRRAAELLGVSYRTLLRRVKEFDLEGFPRYRG